MTKIVELLRKEHSDIRKLLLILEQEINGASEAGHPDFALINNIVSYFRNYPECCHHPKEDMIFERIKERDACAAEVVGDLQAEHRQETERLRCLADLTRLAVAGNDVSWQSYTNAMRDFVEHQRKHMELEEQLFFTAATKTLRPEDWEEIDSRWSEMSDSLFNVAEEEIGFSLRDRIVQWKGGSKT